MSIPNISPPTGLKPQKMFLKELGEDCINMDGVIALMQQTNTPQAKAMNRAFRRRLASFQITMADKPAAKVREEAMIAALGDVGMHLKMIPAKGE